MAIWNDIGQSQSRLVKALNDWWQPRRRTSGIPDRGDLDPADLVPLLPNLLLAEAEHTPFRIRYRLVGTKVAAAARFPFTGRYLDELLRPEVENDWLGYYRTVYDSRLPLAGAVTVPSLSGASYTYEFGIFPLTLGGDRVEQFVSAEDYFSLDFTSALVRPWAER
jgi:hypothetical protein